MCDFSQFQLLWNSRIPTRLRIIVGLNEIRESRSCYVIGILVKFCRETYRIEKNKEYDKFVTNFTLQKFSEAYQMKITMGKCVRSENNWVSLYLTRKNISIAVKFITYEVCWSFDVDNMKYWENSPVTCECPFQRRGTLMFSLVCAWTNGWVSNRDTGDLRHHRAQYDVTIMQDRHFLGYFHYRNYHKCK